MAVGFWSGLDVPGTPRERDAYVAATAALDGHINSARAAVAALAALAPIDPEREWQNFLTASRKTLCDEFEAIPRPVRGDHDLGVSINVRLSILWIDRGPQASTGYVLETLRLGALMKEAGYVAAPAEEGQIFGKLPWYGSLREVEKRIARLERERAVIQSALDEALLSDEARERLTAERAERARARNASPTRKVRGDGSMYDKFSDGKEVEIS